MDAWEPALPRHHHRRHLRLTFLGTSSLAVSFSHKDSHPVDVRWGTLQSGLAWWSEPSGGSLRDQRSGQVGVALQHCPQIPLGSLAFPFLRKGQLRGRQSHIHQPTQTVLFGGRKYLNYGSCSSVECLPTTFSVCRKEKKEKQLVFPSDGSRHVRAGRPSFLESDMY